MEAKHDFSTWQEFLGRLIKNSQEKQRLAREADVRPITLKRWVTGESQPREENIHRLARALAPDLADIFLSLVEKDFPAFVHENFKPNHVVPEISSELYAQAIQTYANTPPALVRDALYRLIIENALQQFDPDSLGMSIALVNCVPPLPGQKVRCLRQIGGMGTPPWEREFGRKTIFLGSESIAGNAVMSYSLVSIESRDSSIFTPANWTDFEQSAIAAPILRQARVAGALLASSSRPHYFTQAHRDLLEGYAHLAALIFDPGEFYGSTDIMLSVMPGFELQAPHFANFGQRVSLKLAEAAQSKSSMTLQLARQRVWQDIAEELLQVPAGE